MDIKDIRYYYARALYCCARHAGCGTPRIFQALGCNYIPRSSIFNDELCLAPSLIKDAAHALGIRFEKVKFCAECLLEQTTSAAALPPLSHFYAAALVSLARQKKASLSNLAGQLKVDVRHLLRDAERHNVPMKPDQAWAGYYWLGFTEAEFLARASALRHRAFFPE